MKNVRSFAVALVAASLLSAIADPQYDPLAPVKPLPVPSAPDREKTSYAIGMNIGMQRKQAKSDADIDVFAKGLSDILQNKLTEIPFTSTMEALNVVRSKGTNTTPQEKHRFAYAMGMRWGNMLKENAADCDVNVIVAAMKDIDQGKPTKIKESEMQPLLEEGRQYSLYVMGTSNRVEGATFLAKKAKEPGVKELKKGALYYRVISEGTGRPIADMDEHDVMFLRYKGSFMDGREFDHHNRFPKGKYGGWRAWTEACLKMKVGDKWEVYSAPEYSLGRDGDPRLKVGPDTTVVWDLEIREIVKENDPRLGGGRLGHGIPGRDNDDDLKELGQPHPIEIQH